MPLVPVPMGYDARMQFIHEHDAVEALAQATTGPSVGIVNVAGDGFVTLLQCLALVRRPIVPVPMATAGIVGNIVKRSGLADFSPDQVAFLAFGRGSTRPGCARSSPSPRSTRPARRSRTSRSTSARSCPESATSGGRQRGCRWRSRDARPCLREAAPVTERNDRPESTEVGTKKASPGRTARKKTAATKSSTPKAETRKARAGQSTARKDKGEEAAVQPVPRLAQRLRGRCGQGLRRASAAFRHTVAVGTRAGRAQCGPPRGDAGQARHAGAAEVRPGREHRRRQR